MTRRNLELVEPLRAGAEGATLLDVIDRTLTPMGGRLLRRWLLAPLLQGDRALRGKRRLRSGDRRERQERCEDDDDGA